MIIAAGFAFWGLFAVFGIIAVGYVVWMRYVERNENQD
jgi:hypothetical protein